MRPVIEILEPTYESQFRRDLRRATRELLDRHLPEAHAQELDRTSTFDPELWAAMADSGLLGIGLPESEEDSIGASMVVTEEIGRRLPGLAVGYVIAAMAVRTLAADGELRSLADRVADGTMIPAYAMSEPDVGTDLFRLRTRARLEGMEWVLDGQKIWTSLGTEADLLLVVARTDPPEGDRLHRGLSLIAVPVDQPGVIRRKVPLAGMRAGMTAEIFFDGARAPAGHLIGQRGNVMRTLGITLDLERLLAAGISLGIGMAAVQLHVEHAVTRQAFGRPIGAFQAVQHPAAESVAELMMLRTLLDSVTDRLTAGEPTRVPAAIANLQAGEITARVVDRGMRALGATGLTEESTMQMLFRDARLALFSPISNEMVRNLVAEAIGLPRSY